MGYKIYFRDGHCEFITTFMSDPDHGVIFYTSGPRRCRYNGVFEEEKTRVTWDINGIPSFEDYWVAMDIIDVRLERVA